MQKRTLRISLLGAIALALVGCSHAQQTTETNSTTPPPTTAAPTTTAPTVNANTPSPQAAPANENVNASAANTNTAEATTNAAASDTNTTAAAPTPQVREIAVTAKQFTFNPSTIEVNEGDTVKLSITSVDVVHGFSIPEFDVNTTLRPNQTSTVEFVANKKGTFTFACSVVCGSGHGGMKGTLVVK